MDFQLCSQKYILKEIFIASSISVFEKGSANYLAQHLGKYFLHHKKRHNYLFSFIKKLFPVLLSSSFSKATGVKISVKGRINGAPRAKTTTLQIGQIPLQSLALEVDYFNQVSHTINGSFGIKVWIYKGEVFAREFSQETNKVTPKEGKQ